MCVIFEIERDDSKEQDLRSEKLAVGPWGKCETVNAVGVPLCSCRSTISLRPPDFALSTRLGRIMFPRFRRMDVGRSNRISLAKVPSLLDGSLYHAYVSRWPALSEEKASLVPTGCDEDSRVDDSR